ncbi:hypothetical protein O7635_35645 [Asanoa sp. WMMD1127]|uniref:hypothetical protein n=1 Tax=Asanoa sp. WMMD1127 TaxID=3016107 RepID=UPI0024171C69|nr:hypothetical protein [Asanoa sp. WMMD1127]MDG4827210.1 hypothetical protein [Asanoa sp. WMMD1127]
MMKRALGGALAALAMAGGFVAVSATSASATAATAKAAAAPRCSTTTLTNTRGWTTTGGGTVRVVQNGVQLATPRQESAVQYRWNLPQRVRLADVAQLSYQTTKLDGTTVGGVAIAPGNDAALPAYRLFLDLTNNGSVDGAIVFEPYYQITGNPTRGETRTWDVDAGKFWTSATIPGMVTQPGGSYADNKTLAQIRNANPQARIVAIAIGQGTYNDGTVARVNQVRFDGGRVCQVFNWRAAAQPSWRVRFDPARCGDRTSDITVANTGRVNITVRFNNGRNQTVRPGSSVVERFRSGRVTVFVNGRNVGEYRHQQLPCRPTHVDSRH